MPTQEFTYMKHPHIEGTVRVSRRAFDSVYSGRGWTEVDAAAVAASEALGSEVKNLGALTKDELVEVAQSLGLDPGTMTKPELIANIEAVRTA